MKHLLNKKVNMRVRAEGGVVSHLEGKVIKATKRGNSISFVLDNGEDTPIPFAVDERHCVIDVVGDA